MVRLKEADYSETDEFTLIKEMNHWIKDLKKFFVDDSKAQKAIADYFYYDDGAHQEDFKELKASVKTLHKLWLKLDAITEDAEEKEYKEKNKKESIARRSHTLYEQDVEIEVKHEGILEVPEGMNVDDLPMSHFEKLAKKKGLSKITKALNNLQVWNKNDDPELSKWAGDMIDKLNKKLKRESLTRLKRESREIPIGWKERTITVDDDEQEAAVEEILSYAKRDNDKIEWDIDYNGGMFGEGRVFYIYSDGDTFSEVQYTIKQMKDDAVYGRGVYEAVKHSHYGSSPESRRKEVSDRLGVTFTPDDHMLVCKDGKILNIQIGKKYRCTAFDGQRVEIVDIEQIIDGDDGDSAMVDVVYRNKRYTVTSNQLYESAKRYSTLDESTKPFETVEDAARYYFDNWYNGFIDNDEIRRNLRRNGYSDDFIHDVFEFISELSDDADEYWDDDFDESLNEADYAGYFDPFDYQKWGNSVYR